MVRVNEVVEDEVRDLKDELGLTWKQVIHRGVGLEALEVPVDGRGRSVGTVDGL